ncbi:MAG: sodium/solute symporter [Bryobacteraceae bacterium]
MRTFTLLEYSILFGYLTVVAAIGAAFYRKQSTAKDYFLGGKSMSWLPVGISIVAADLSAITLMGVPAWMFQNNYEMAWGFLGPALAAPIMIYVFIPFYSGLNLYTAYEYLERRFDLRVRLVTSALFLFLRLVHVAIAIYGPSLAMSLATGLPMYQCVLGIGALTTLYTTSGGVRAVIWTDVIQFSTICLGVTGILWAALRQIDGGARETVRLAWEAGRLGFWNPSLNPSDTMAFWPSIIGGTTLTLASLATDQALIQRLFTTRSGRDAKQSIVANAVLQVPLLLLLGLVGTVLFAFYRQHPELLAGLPNNDAILPFFAVQQLPRGICALVIAAIFAATMAVMSAGINSLSTAFTVDFYQRLWRPEESPRHYATFGRAATAAWGAVATLLALFMGRLGALVLAYAKVSSLVGGPMLGIFLLGMLTRRATAVGTLYGAVAGAAAVAAVAAFTNVSFYYHVFVGMAITVLGGYLASRFTAPPSSTQLDGLVMERSWSWKTQA